MNDITRILNSIENGDGKASDELLPLVYQELRHLAAHKMNHEAAGHTLQPTALVHEAWMRCREALFFCGVDSETGGERTGGVTRHGGTALEFCARMSLPIGQSQPQQFFRVKQFP